MPDNSDPEVAKTEALVSPKPPVFAKKDYITIAISIFALFISILAFYFNNLRIDDDLSAKIINVDLTGRKDTTDEDNVILELLLINSGNREAIILSPTLWLSKNRDKNQIGINLGDNNPLFPFNLGPHQVKIVNLRISFNDINAEKGIYMTNFYNSKIYRRYGLLEYNALDSKANKHTVQTQYIFDARTTDKLINNIVPAFEADSNGYRSTKIF
jgi:hypothetical protein